MPSKSCLAGLLLLAVATAACETTQPQQVEKQTVELRFAAGGAPRLSGGQGIRSFDTWVFVEDGDRDPDTDDPIDDAEYLFCQDILPTQTHNTPSSVPWSYTLRVSVIPAGETTAVPVTSQLSLIEAPTVNLTAYDGAGVNDVVNSSRQPICLDANNQVLKTNFGQSLCRACEFNLFRSCQTDSQCSGLGACILNPNTERMFRFVNNSLRRLSQATRVVATALENPLADVNPEFSQLGRGRCSVVDPGPTVIDGESTFTLEINKGDTVIVEARRGETAPPGLPFEGSIDGNITLNATFLVDGLNSNVNGTKISPSEPGGGLKFTFTSR